MPRSKNFVVLWQRAHEPIPNGLTITLVKPEPHMLSFRKYFEFIKVKVTNGGNYHG